MGKVTLGIWAEKNKKLVLIIRAYMIRAGIKRDKMVAKACISAPTFYAHMQDPDKISLREFRAYINTLKIPKEDVLDALYLKE